MGKRATDFLVSLLGLIALLPLLLVVGLLVRTTTPGPAFFRQERVGRHGRVFRIHKFRTMTADPMRVGRELTVGEDRRITPMGRWLRRYKVDELPQLIDVLYGDMSLVGPRPEVPKYVALYPEREREVVLSVRPGITDPASIEFRDESMLLGRTADPERDYIEHVLPAKLALSVEYVRQRSWFGDFVIIARTLRAIAR